MEELKHRMDRDDDFILVDVREPNEFEIVNIGGRLVPLADLPNRMNELDLTRDIVVYCKSGARSRRAVDFLRTSGFTRVKNLVGGIDAWAQRIDPQLARY